MANLMFFCRSSYVKHHLTSTPLSHIQTSSTQAILKRYPIKYFHTQPVLLSQLSQPQKPNKELFQSYEPKLVEEGWEKWWNELGIFKSSGQKDGNEKMIRVLFPPPNVTGRLHIGHALTCAIQDSLVRRYRMLSPPGSVEFIPGTDHAGIATQVVVEKMLKLQGKNRLDMGREEFVKSIWNWTENQQEFVENQLRKLGTSFDWSSKYFTLDEKRSEFVTKTFVSLFEKGLIYRDTRFVNWSCSLKTAISDLEVESEAITGPTWKEIPGKNKKVQFGVLHEIAYPLVEPSSSGLSEITISTTRVETMFGDVAIAVNPKDERYLDLHYKNVIHPLTGRKIPIIPDIIADPTFGTGAVKITPSHDLSDAECGKRNSLEFISVIQENGTLNSYAGDLEGMDRFESREIIIERLKKSGFYRGEKSNPMTLSICSRSGDIIEPLSKPQWYINCQEMAKEAYNSLQDSKIQMVPSIYDQDWLRWLGNPTDWCISRQLWWGHQIPVYLLSVGKQSQNEEFFEQWIAAENLEEAQKKTQQILQQKGFPTSTQFTLKQDEDVLDTWFSSALLPLSTFNQKDYSIFSKDTNQITTTPTIPLTFMETGSDILFFWVARMVMLCTKMSSTNSLPFDKVLLHGIVRDSQGRKMSKSLGNVIDPMYIIDGVSRNNMEEEVLKRTLSKVEQQRSLENLRKEFPNGIEARGADSLRLTLVGYPYQSRFINLDSTKISTNRIFGNKLWNATKFVFMNLPSNFEMSHPFIEKFPTQWFSESNLPSSHSAFGLAEFVNSWILSRLSQTITKVNSSFEAFNLRDASEITRDFILDEFCDVFIEFSKVVLYQSSNPNEVLATRLTLCSVLDASLRLLHPFMPFITEELFQHLKSKTKFLLQSGYEEPISICISRFPQTSDYSQFYSPKIEEEMKIILDLLHVSRSLRKMFELPLNMRFPFGIETQGEKETQIIQNHLNHIQYFIQASPLEINSEISFDKTKAGSFAVNENLTLYLPLRDKSINFEEQKEKLQKKLKKNSTQLQKLRARISNSDYKLKAKKDVIERDEAGLRELLAEEEQIKKTLDLLSRF